MMKTLAVTAARKEAYAKALAAAEARKRERFGDALVLSILDDTPEVLVRLASGASGAARSSAPSRTRHFDTDAISVRTRLLTEAPSHGGCGGGLRADFSLPPASSPRARQSGRRKYLWYAAHDDCAWYDARSAAGRLLKAVLPSHCVDEMWVSPDLSCARWTPPPPAVAHQWHDVIRLQAAGASAEDTSVRRREIGIDVDALRRAGAGGAAAGTAAPVLRSTRASRAEFLTFEPWSASSDTSSP